MAAGRATEVAVSNVFTGRKKTRASVPTGVGAERTKSATLVVGSDSAGLETKPLSLLTLMLDGSATTIASVLLLPVPLLTWNARTPSERSTGLAVLPALAKVVLNDC